MFKIYRLGAVIIILTLCVMLRPSPARMSVIPAAVEDNYVTNEDTSLSEPSPGVLINDSDDDGDPLTAVLVSGPAHGALTLNPDGSFTYTPTADFNGADAFTYQASDGSAASDAVTVSLTVNPVNDAPTAGDQTVSTDEDTPLVVALSGTDPEGGALTFEVVVGPAHGTLSGAAPELTYTPNANYSGSDSFIFRVNDGALASPEATVTITVTAVNDAPTAHPDAYSTDEDNILTVSAPGLLANDTDVDSGSLSASVLGNPSSGTLALNADGSFTYTPNVHFSGTDSFTYKVSDGTAESGTATVTITVAEVNAAPDATGQSVTTDEDTAKAITLMGTDPDGDALTFEVVTGPAHGTLTGTAPNLTYTPAANYNGADSFTFTAGDGSLTSAEATVNITVNAVNDTPGASADAYASDEDALLSVAAPGVLANDADVDGTSLTAVLVSGPAHGALTLNPDGSFTYTPTADFNGADAFTYQASDGSAASDAVTVSLTVNPVNDAPTAAGDTYTTDEDVALTVAAPGVLANDADAEGSGISAVLLSNPSHGTLALNPDGSFLYTPAANYNGADSFTYKAHDGAADSGGATVTITVTAVNDAPVASADNYTTNDNTPLSVAAPGVLTNDIDAEGNSLTATLVSGTAHGALTLNPDGSFSYTPDTGYYGSDSFSYKSNDGGAQSDIANVNITINLVNVAPLASNQTVTTAEDIAKSITLAATDGDGDALTFSVVAGPAHGTLTGTAPNLVYTPNANYSGSDSFTFKVNDGVTDSNTATVSVTITAVNDPPAGNPDSYPVDEDNILTVAAPGVLANDAEVDGQPMTATKLTNPANGTLTSFGSNGSFTYKPKADFNGTDSFTYKVSDGGLESGAVTVTITINPGNDIPVVSKKSFSLKEDGSKAFALTGTDIDGDVLTFSVVTPPTHGTLSGIAPNLTYTSEPNYNGPDSLEYVANDGLADSLAATVTITVNPANDTPVATAQSVTTREDTPKTITLEGTDIDGDVLTFSVVTPPAHGTLSGTAPNLTYTPALDYSGSDSFTFRANDGTVNSATATVSITVNQGNDAPVATAQSVATFKNLLKPVTLAATDADGDALLFSIVTPPAHGTLSGTVPNLIYTPALDYLGSDSFAFKASDGAIDSNIATVTITVHSLNNFPVANPDSYIVNEDVNLSVTLALGLLANDTSAPGTTRTAIKLTNPVNGTLSAFNSNGAFTYKPKGNFNGADSFTYKITDGTVESAPTTVTITVNPVNDAPVATAQSVIVAKDAPALITPTATDVDGDVLTFSIVTPPVHGTLTGSSPDFVYTPAAGYTGADSFTFRASDGAGGLSAIATVSITVNALDTNITAVDDKYSAKNPNQNVAASKGVLLNDTDTLSRAKTAVLVNKPAHGTLALKTDGSFTYTPVPGFYGNDSFTYRARAGNGLSNLATVNLFVEYEALTKVDLPVNATVASYSNFEYVEVNGTVKYQASTVWNYQVKQLNDKVCADPLPAWYQTDYNKTSFVGTAVGQSSGHAYEFKISSSKHDLCTPFPPFDWHRIINVVLTDKVTGVSHSTAFVHQVHANATGFTDVPPILDGNFIEKQGQTTPQWAYVTNPGANTVTVVDLKNRKTLKTIAVGSGPDGVNVTPTASHVYVANSGSDTVSVIDTLTNTVVATIPVGDEPRRVVIDRLGLRVYVTNKGSNSISVISTATNSVIETIDAVAGFAGLSPVGLAINNLGTQLYVANTGSNSISVINTLTGATVTDIPTPGTPGELAVKQDGSRLAVSLPGAATVQITRTSDYSTVALVPVGLNPAGLDFATPGDNLYVANTGSNSISVINMLSNSVVTTITDSVGNSPTGVDISDHGLQITVANAGSNTASDIAIQNTSNVVNVSNRVRVNIGAGPGASKVVMLF